MNDNEKKNEPSFIRQVTILVTAGVSMLVCTTLYNLVLAHIWPVTIHFGEYSLNNFLFILVSVITSVLLAILVLALEMYYILNILGHGLLHLVTPPEKRKPYKHPWFTSILDAFLLAATGIFYLLTWCTQPTGCATR
jgi:signal transduction histidine kinase